MEWKMRSGEKERKSRVNRWPSFIQNTSVFFVVVVVCFRKRIVENVKQIST